MPGIRCLVLANLPSIAFCDGNYRPQNLGRDHDFFDLPASGRVTQSICPVGSTASRDLYDGADLDLLPRPEHLFHDREPKLRCCISLGRIACHNHDLDFDRFGLLCIPNDDCSPTARTGNALKMDREPGDFRRLDSFWSIGQKSRPDQGAPPEKMLKAIQQSSVDRIAQ